MVVGVKYGKLFSVSSPDRLSSYFSTSLFTSSVVEKHFFNEKAINTTNLITNIRSIAKFQGLFKLIITM